MRLLSCTIEHFGALSESNYAFREGLNVFLQDNGKGKTTLCAFLKAMLYGLPSVRADSFNARSHYYPFAGGKYGGSLTLEKDGKIYRIERFFDKKSEKKDECKVYCNDRLIESQNIGQELFGLNEESFERTVLFTSEDTEGRTDEEIVLKLNRVVQNTDGEALEKAKFLLSKAKKVYRADRGNNDEISHTKEALARYDALLSEAEQTKASLQEAQARYRELEKNIPVLEDADSDLQKRKVACERYTYYKAAADECAKVQEEKSKLYYRYPKGLPTEEELKQIALIERETIFYQGKQEELEFSHEEEWRKLDERYGRNEPTEEVLNTVREQRDELMVLERKLSAYADGHYEEKPTKFSRIPYLLLCIAVIVALAVGVALWQFSYFDYAKYTFIGGIVLLALDGFFYLLRAIRWVSENQNKRRESREDVIHQAKKIRSSLVEFFAEYGLQGDVKNLPDVMTGDLVTFHALSAEKADKERRKRDFALLQQKNDDKLFFIRQKYNLNDESYETLSALKAKDDALSESLQTLGERMEKYRMEPVSYSEEEETTLKELLKNSRKEFIELKTQIEQMEHVAEKVERYRSQRALAAEHLADIERRERLLLKTMELLSRAGDNLRSRYVSPVKMTFRAYAERLKKISDTQLSLDENFAVSFEKNGEKHTEEYLSSGEKAIAFLCMRLSLLDGMYEGETPFLLFDDAFALLDQGALEKVETLLKDLGKDRQILYFTCHPSRSFV